MIKDRWRRFKTWWLATYERAHKKKQFLGTLFLTGSILGGALLIMFLLDVFILIVDFFNIIFYFLFEKAMQLVGLEAQFQEWQIVNNIYENGDMSSQYYFENTFEFANDLVLVLFAFFSKISSFFKDLFVMNFPILQELNINLSWLVVDFTRVLRTFFSLLQFFLLFLFTRKIRRWIHDKFSPKTDWSEIKHF